MRRRRLLLPPDAQVRLHVDGAAPSFTVVIARSPRTASLSEITQPGALAAILTHSDEMCWPDARGERLAAEMLMRGGSVALTFPRLGAALDCRARLVRERAA